MGAKGKVFLFTPLLKVMECMIANSTTAANGNEREQVLPLLDKVKLKTLKPGRPRKKG